MEDKMGNSYLTTLIGKEIRAYKSGPESWHGLLLDVKSDHIKLFNQKDGYIYYKTEFIKNVIAESVSNTTEMNNHHEHHHKSNDDFHDVLESLIDQKIKVNRGGPESKTGTLLAVTDEYLVIHSEKDGVIYFNLEHIKGVSAKAEEGKQDKDDEKDNKEEKEKEEKKEVQSNIPNFIDVNSMHRLFKRLRYGYVIINHGPESVEGVLVDTKDNLLVLVVRDEVLRVNQNHVKSIREKVKQEGTGGKGNNKHNNQAGGSVLALRKQRQDQKKGYCK